MITELNERAASILRYIVDAYVDTGAPVGSATISRALGINLSPASIRSIMAELENDGLLFSPHTSAGRLPTRQGLRLYVDGLMEVGTLSAEERTQIELRCKTAGHSMEALLEQATTTLSGLSAAAGLVIAPKSEKPVRQIQFVPLDQHRVLIVIVLQNGMVENRVLETGTAVSALNLAAATNYLNERLAGHTLAEAQNLIAGDISSNRAQLDTLTADLVQRGIALGAAGENRHIIIRGQARLLEDVRALEDLENARQLLAALEQQETVARLLEATRDAQGVQIFIGAENKMFDHAGWSMVIAPYKASGNQIVGAIGVIGPTRLNYGRVIPLLDYTGRVIEKIVGG